ncbi:RimK family alpha-L-glutamate ligase [Legionella dresdenensis]|uniref:RimK family alpha-L-glutamate ligase n=1 Tax=Legionella dresdenensis TaxID=450200 RepID=A0ABV8CFW5_9GAMM
MKGWIFYKRGQKELTDADHGVNRLVAESKKLAIDLSVINPASLELIISAKEPRILLNGKQIKAPDFIIPRTGADTTYQALALLRQFELSGVYCANTPESIENVKDKLLTGQLMMKNGLPIPKTMLLNFPVSAALVEQELGFPIVMKAIAGAKGNGVCLCESVNSFIDLLGLLGPQPNQTYIAQQFIASSYGRDLRVFVLGERVIGCMQRTAHHSFKANYSLGGDVSAFPLNSEIEHLALTCSKTVGLEIAGIDLLFGPDGFIVCEANSSPGFKGMELATGDNIAAQILSYVVAQVEAGK